MSNYNVLIHFSDQDRSYPVLAQGFSLKECVGAGGKHATQTCALRVKSREISALFLTETQKYIPCELKQGTSVIFEGVARPYQKLSAQGNDESPFAFEIMDMTEAMHIQLEEHVYIGETLEEIIDDLYSKSNFSQALNIPEELSEKTVNYIKIENSQYLDEVLSAILFEYGYDFLFSVGNCDIIPTTTEAVPNQAINDIETTFNVQRSDDWQDGLNCSYKDLGVEKGLCVGAINRCYDESGWTIYVRERRSGLFYDNDMHHNVSVLPEGRGLVAFNFRDLFSKVPNAQVVGIDNLRVTAYLADEDGVSISPHVEYVDLNTCKMWVSYSGNFDIQFGKAWTFVIRIYADVSYLKGSSTELYVQNGIKPQDVALKYVNTQQDAVSYGQREYARQKNKGVTYTFSSRTHYSAGEFYVLDEDNVTFIDTVVRILSCERDMNGIFSIKAEGANAIGLSVPISYLYKADVENNSLLGFELNASKLSIIPPEILTVTASGSLTEVVDPRISFKWFINDTEVSSTQPFILTVQSDSLQNGDNLIELRSYMQDVEGAVKTASITVTCVASAKIEYGIGSSFSDYTTVETWASVQPVPTASKPYIWARTSTSGSWVYLCMNKPADASPTLTLSSNANAIIRDDRSPRYESITFTASILNYTYSTIKWFVNDVEVTGASTNTYIHAYSVKGASGLNVKVQLLDTLGQEVASKSLLVDSINNLTQTRHTFGSSERILPNAIYSEVVETEPIAGKTYFVITNKTSTAPTAYIYEAVEVSSFDPTETYYQLDGYYINGDSFVLVSVTGDLKTSEVYVCNNESWQSLENLSDYPLKEAILAESLPSVFEQAGASANHVQANGYDWFRQIISEYISGIVYYVGGYIYGGDVSVSPDGEGGYIPTFTGRGFFLDKNGQFQCNEGTFNSIKVSKAQLDDCEITNSRVQGKLEANAFITYDGVPSIGAGDVTASDWNHISGTEATRIDLTVDLPAGADYKIVRFGSPIKYYAFPIGKSFGAANATIYKADSIEGPYTAITCQPSSKTIKVSEFTDVVETGSNIYMYAIGMVYENSGYYAGCLWRTTDCVTWTPLFTGDYKFTHISFYTDWTRQSMCFVGSNMYGNGKYIWINSTGRFEDTSEWGFINLGNVADEFIDVSFIGFAGNNHCYLCTMYKKWYIVYSDGRGASYAHLANSGNQNTQSILCRFTPYDDGSGGQPGFFVGYNSTDSTNRRGTGINIYHGTFYSSNYSFSYELVSQNPSSYYKDYVSSCIYYNNAGKAKLFTTFDMNRIIEFDPDSSSISILQTVFEVKMIYTLRNVGYLILARRAGISKINSGFFIDNLISYLSSVLPKTTQTWRNQLDEGEFETLTEPLKVLHDATGSFVFNGSTYNFTALKVEVDKLVFLVNGSQVSYTKDMGSSSQIFVNNLVIAATLERLETSDIEAKRNTATIGKLHAFYEAYFQKLFLSNLPTTAPATRGAVWNDNGTLKIVQ